MVISLAFSGFSEVGKLLKLGIRQVAIDVQQGVVEVFADLVHQALALAVEQPLRQSWELTVERIVGALATKPLQQLSEGDWLVTQKGQHLQLIWANAASDHYVLVDHQGRVISP